MTIDIAPKTLAICHSKAHPAALLALRNFCLTHLRIVCEQSKAMRACSEAAIARGKKPSPGTDQVRCLATNDICSVKHARTTCRDASGGENPFLAQFNVDSGSNYTGDDSGTPEKHNGIDVYTALAAIDRKDAGTVINVPARAFSHANKAVLACDKEARLKFSLRVTEKDVKDMIATLKPGKPSKGSKPTA